MKKFNPQYDWEVIMSLGAKKLHISKEKMVRNITLRQKMKCPYPRLKKYVKQKYSGN